MSRAWLGRLAGAAGLALVGYGVLVLMDFGPRPLAWALLTLLGCALAWLVIDTTDTERSVWYPTLPVPGDRVEETTTDHRILDNHAASSRTSPVLRDRLVALARSRDPALSDPELRALAAEQPRRLTPSEIDHYLTRIEALRDRT